MKELFHFLGLLLVLTFLGSCATIPVKKEIRKVQEIASLSDSNTYIKAHMQDGTVYILHNWTFNEADSTLIGHGSFLDINRNVLETTGNPKTESNFVPFEICLQDIAILETNDPGPSIAGRLAVVTGATAIVAVVCLVNPKACFGSCPTFYVYNGDSLALQAEGFSTSVSPTLESNDIDMLYYANPTKDFEIVVTNEALETHSINYANLLAFEKGDDERIFASPNESFYRCTNILEPDQCHTNIGDHVNLVAIVDGDEYYSPSDSKNLNSKEEIFLSFANNDYKNPGLIIGKRQTLLTTFLLYQGMAYMGNSVTYWMAEHARGKIEKKSGIFDILGGIEVYSKDTAGNWKFEGLVNETGPIATDINIIPLSLETSGSIELRLVLNKGLWRIDYLALAEISERVFPLIIEPISVEKLTGHEINPLIKLLNDNEYLVTYPGDKYKIKYSIPFENAELFIDSKGYYLEWIREEWVQEQDFNKLRLMFYKPAKYLKKIAPEYKILEPSMEETFWNSKYVKN